MRRREPTPGNPTGPAYRRHMPYRDRLDEGARGTPLLLHGRVVLDTGEAVPDAIVELWHASPHGVYSVVGHRFRGRVRTDPQGWWRVRSVVPGGYLWRPPHVHVKVRWRGRELLTTQLYLPGHRRLASDPNPRAALIVKPEVTGRGLVVRYDLVVEMERASVERERELVW